MASPGAVFGKKKWHAFQLGKGCVFISGLVSSSYIACLLPSVMDFIVPKEQQTSMNSIGHTTANYWILTNLCLGITNLLTLPNFDASSIIQSIKANVFTYGTMVAVQYYHYRYYGDAMNKKFLMLSMTLNGSLLFLSLYSNMRLEAAFPKNQALRSMAIVKKPSKRKRVKRVREEMKGTDADVEDNDENEPIFHKKGQTFWAQYYKEGVHDLKIEKTEDDLFLIKHCGLCIADSNKASFKLSQVVKSVVIENCEGVSVEITEDVASIDIVNSNKCTIYVRKKSGAISVENCNAPKLVLFNAALNMRPTIMSSNAVNFEIDVQKEDSEDSDWKSFMVPVQLQTEIDVESLTAHSTTIRL